MRPTQKAKQNGKVIWPQAAGGCQSAAVPPFLLKTPDNPEGVDGSVCEGIKKAIAADRPAFLSTFLSDFYNVDTLGGKPISDEVVRLSWNIAAGASPKGTLDCVSAWVTDTGAAPAIANAIYHAAGKRIRELPITPDRLLSRA